MTKAALHRQYLTALSPYTVNISQLILWLSKSFFTVV